MEPAKIGAAKFKEHCLSILDELDNDGIIVTKHGKAVARVLPMPKNPVDMIGSLKNSLSIHGDIMSTGISWDASD